MYTTSVLYARIDNRRRRITCEHIGDDIEVMQTGCPHCGCEHTRVVSDVLQLGVWEDRGLLIKTCDQCSKAWGYKYTIEVSQEWAEGAEDERQQN